MYQLNTQSEVDEPIDNKKLTPVIQYYKMVISPPNQVGLVELSHMLIYKHNL